MRSDARRNADRLRDAARTLFHERGLNVSLKEIARAAGVSHGTLYNLYGGREALVDEVIADLVATYLGEASSAAQDHADAWEGFAFYVTQVCELQVTHPVIADVVSGTLPSSANLMALCTQALDSSRQVIARAKEAGRLRPDVTGEDLLLVFAASAALARLTEATQPGAWRRHVELLLDGFHAR